jgi:hypothetical protein
MSLPSCKKDDTIPAYVYIPAITVNATAAQGSSSSKIVDAWVYINDNLQGAYKLPARFPIRASGTTKLRIFPGVLANGIAATRLAYPFYKDTTMSVDLVPGETDTIYPQTTYETNAKFAMNESFTTGDPFTNMSLFTNSPDVFEAPNSARLNMPDSAYTVSAVSTRLNTIIPSTTAAFFLEMDYKCNTNFTVGLNIYGSSLLTDPAIDKIVLTPKSDWNKIYINFTPEVNTYQGNDYELVFSASRSNLSDSVNILFDNIKLIYY